MLNKGKDYLNNNLDNFKFTFVDLFAGIGGIRLGFEQVGGKCVFSSEWDKYAQQTYQANFGEVPEGDITKIDPKSVPDHDILTAGFPCQAFSIAGRRLGFEDIRGTMFFYVAKILDVKRPKAFLLENVKGLANHDRGKTLKVILDVLRNDLDYYVPDPKILNAKDFGVPQNRERIYIVGFRKDIIDRGFTYPTKFGTSAKVKDILEEKPVSPKYYLSTQYLETLEKHKQRHLNKGNGFGYEIIDLEGVANAIVVGGMGRERNLIIDKRLSDYNPVTNIKGQINREGIRRMTPREWARLQGFPDDYKIVVSDTQAYKQFGNSVAVPVIRAIATEMIKKISEKSNCTLSRQEEAGSMSWSVNRGEWSEAYVFLKLLGEGKLYAGDGNLNRLNEIYYPIIKILREELIGNFEYCIEDNIKVVNSATGEVLCQVNIGKFIEMADYLLQKIYENKKGNFSVPEVEQFMKEIKCCSVKAKSSDKRDITIMLHDINTGYEPTVGFSIKSKLGSPSTLLNASKNTNFIFRLSSNLNDAKVNDINRISGNNKIQNRIKAIFDEGVELMFAGMESEVFESNLRVIDSELPRIIAYLLLSYYSSPISKVSDLTDILNNQNPCQYPNVKIYPFYEHKIKNLLTVVALGMLPGTPWNGRFDASGGYIVVREDGDVLCYHIYQYNEFQDYLFKNTRLETASSGRHEFGTIYDYDGQQYINLNLQIRFL